MGNDKDKLAVKLRKRNFSLGTVVTMSFCRDSTRDKLQELEYISRQLESGEIDLDTILRRASTPWASEAYREVADLYYRR